MAHGFAHMDGEEAAERLGIGEDEILELPIPWGLGPDGDVWYARGDVEVLQVQGWQPESSQEEREEEPEDLQDEEYWESPNNV